MGKSFKEFCTKVATNEIVTVDSSDNSVPETYRTKLDSLVTIMRPRMKNLDRINVRFIEDAFEDINEVKEKLDKKTVDGDIPDGVLNELSKKLYDGKSFNEIAQDEQMIIKVLAVYLCIQN